MTHYADTLKKSGLYLYLLSLHWGAVCFALKLVSVVQIIEALSLEFFPLLMGLQGLIFLLTLSAFDRLAQRGQRLYYTTTILTGSVTVLLVSFPFGRDNSVFNIVISSLVFLLSNVALIAIEVVVHEYLAAKVSILRNPNFSPRSTLVIEGGYFLAALIGFYGPQSGFFPFLLKFGPFLLLLWLLINNPATDRRVRPAEKQEDPFALYPFVTLMLLVFTLLFLSKHLALYASLKGFVGLQHREGGGIHQLFSAFSMIEAALVMLSLGATALRRNGGSGWTFGFNLFLVGQGLIYLTLTFFHPPIVLVMSNVFRKVFENAFLNISKKVFDASIPRQIRLGLKTFVDNRANAAAFAGVAVLVAPAALGTLPEPLLWASGALISVFGMVALSRLFQRITTFHVANLGTQSIEDCVGACYSLANRRSAVHNYALLSLLRRGPRPVVEKAIVYALGEMGNPENIESIIASYNGCDREDIKLEAVRALLKYQSYDVDLFLTQTYEQLIKEDVLLGSMKTKLMTVISSRDKKLAILAVYRLYYKIKKNDDVDERVLANLVDIMGQLACQYHDQALFDSVAEFLGESTRRRVLFNAVKHLYFDPRHRKAAQKYLDLFVASENQNNRNAVCYIAGHLMLRGLLPFIVENSRALEHQNSTILVALIKLDYKPAYPLLAQFLLTASKKKAVVALHQLNAVEKLSARLRVYFYVFEKNPHFAQTLLNLLRSTKKDFTEDRMRILEEVHRRGLRIDAEEQGVFIDPDRPTLPPILQIRAAKEN